VKIFFNHKLINCDTNTGELHFENNKTKEMIHAHSDLIVGADGCYSNVRQSLLKSKPIDFAQSYLAGYYMELRIPACKNGQFAIPPKHLHIWPRGQFMLIALPNQDCSFTCTLFMPLEMFQQVNTSTILLEFFEKYFSDALDLIGRESLCEVYFSSEALPLVSIKCSSHHGRKCVLLGDSAHSMVPFYGQGMNCGFEDCVVFFELLDKHGFENLETIFDKYSEIRVPDAHAICDLAYQNYEEMAYLCTTRKYKLRKQLDKFLNMVFPNYWIPLYSMVTFSRIRYSEVVERKVQQDKIIKLGGLFLLALLGSGGAWAGSILIKKVKFPTINIPSLFNRI
jgi:kynurenine 3-monooxygenase